MAIEKGPVTVTFTDDERMMVTTALATLAQTMHVMPEYATPAWSALAKVVGQSVGTVQDKFGTRPPTLADAARGIAMCELEIAKERSKKVSR